MAPAPEEPTEALASDGATLQTRIADEVESSDGPVDDGQDGDGSDGTTGPGEENGSITPGPGVPDEATPVPGAQTAPSGTGAG